MRRTLVTLALLAATADLAAAVTGFVVDEDGKPLPRARVRAIALETPDALHARLISATPDPVALGEAQTGETGAFRVETKREAVVTLVIDAPGRAIVTADAVDGEDAGTFVLHAAPLKKGRVTADGKPVAGAMVNLENVFFVKTDASGEYSAPDPTGWLTRLIVIHPGYAIAERTRNRDTWPSLDVALERGATARGRVTDPAGRPVTNATIRAGVWPLATSAEDGSFTIANLPANVKALTAREGSRAGSAKAGAEAIVVRPAATLAGTIHNSKDETPVGGMRVALRGDTPYLAGAITDAKGQFAIEAVPAGIHQLGGSHPAFQTIAVNDVQAREGERTDRALAATPLARVTGVVVDEARKPVGGARVFTFGATTSTAPDGTFGVRFPASDRATTLDVSKPAYAAARFGPVRLEPGETRSGVRITLPRGTRFEFRLIDASGQPIAGEPLLVTPFAEADARGEFVPPLRCGAGADAGACRTDAEGTLVMNVNEGTYEVRAGGATTISKHLRGVALTAAESPMVIELERGAVVEGRVVWSDGTAVTVPASVRVADAGMGSLVQVIDGAFAMRNVRAGKLTLVAQTAPPGVIAGEPVEVTAPASGVVLRLPRPGRIEGRVVEQQGSRPVTQFTVAAEPRGGGPRFPGSSRSFTASDGRFTLEDVAPGSFDVHVTSPGFVRATTSAVEVAEGKATTVEVAVERAGSVAGRVTAGGRPVAGAAIITAGEQRMRVPQAKQTDANGEYVIDTLPAGTHELTVRREGYVSRTITVNVAVGRETRGDVELSRGRELQGRVVDSAGRPVAGAEVSYSAGAAYTSRNPPLTTDADGAFRIEGLEETVYSISARKGGYADTTMQVNPATVPSITLTLDRGTMVTGRVNGLTPAELASVEVSAMPRSPGLMSRPARSPVNPDGTFALHGVPDGEVTITAMELRPPRRRVSSEPVKIASGSAPFVELDFAAGYAVRGQVVRGGKPVRGSVHFVPVEQRPGARFASGEIAANGSYEARVPAAGQYRVMVSSLGSSIGTTETGTIEIRGDMQHDIELRGAAIRGRVIDASSGVGLPDASVILRGVTSGGADRPADSAGRFVFDFVPDGRYTLNATKAGYASEPREVVVQQGADVEIDLAVSRGHLVTIRLVDAATGRDADAFATITDAAGRVVGERPSRDPAGGLRFWLQPGTYVVRAIGRDYEPKTAPLTVPETPLVQLELTRVKRE